MSPGLKLVWFRNDLRLSDNAALHHAIQSGSPVLGVFVWHPKDHGHWNPGAASRCWLHSATTSGDDHEMRNAQCKCTNERKRAGNN